MKKTLLIALSLAAMGTTAYAQDPAAGEDVFKKCRACHQVGETAKNAVGPKLNGIIGRTAGSVDGFNYSPANKGSGVTWTEDTFKKYIVDPKAFMPGNKMAFAGVKDDKDVADLLAFLKQYDAEGKKK
ncbi:MAG: c-type cytochrome [Hyphomicrobiaceae bacterium]